MTFAAFVMIMLALIPFLFVLVPVAMTYFAPEDRQD